MNTQLQSKVRLLRIIDGRMISSDCSLKLTLDVGTDKKGNEEIYKKQLTAINTWINVILNNSIVYSTSSTQSDKLINLLEEFSNNIILSPTEPNDYVMVALLYSKFNAIGNGYIKITNLIYESDTGDGFIMTMSDESDDELPTLKEWLGEKTYFDKTWWNRSDGSTLDFPVTEGSDINDKPDILIDLTEFLDDDDSEPIVDKPAEIIKPAFKPIILDGKNNKFTK